MAFNATSVGVRRRNRFFLRMFSISCLIIVFIIYIIVYIVLVAMRQNFQVIAISFGCFWYSVLEFLQHLGDMCSGGGGDEE